MSTKMRRGNFIKDLVIWFMVSVLLASSFAAGLAAVTDKYFGKAIAAIMGDTGEYDLLFQVRSDMRRKAMAELNRIVADKFPGAKVQTGISIAGKSTLFLTFPDKYRTKAVFSNLWYYFGNLPGGASYSIVTEPRLSVSGVPGGVYDRIIREFDALSGVRFSFRDGSDISVVLKDPGDTEQVTAGIRRVLKKYSNLEIKFPADFATKNISVVGRDLAKELAGKDGVTFIRDVTMGDRADDYQALLGTLSEMKRFLLTYAAEIRLTPKKGQTFEAGDRLVMAGAYEGKIQEGMKLRSEQVVIEVISGQPEDEMPRGIIVQGDASQVKATDTQAYRLKIGDKLGPVAASVEMQNKREELIHALDEGILLLTQARDSASDLLDTSGRAQDSITAAAGIQDRMRQAETLMNQTLAGLDKMTGPETQERLEFLAKTLNSVGDDLKFLSDSFARVRLVESQLDKAASSIQTFRTLLNIGEVVTPGKNGEIGQKLAAFDENVSLLLQELQNRARSLDDFINRFNPLVRVLLSWQNQANQFAEGVRQLTDLMEEDVPVKSLLADLTGLTEETLATVDSLDFAAIQKDLNQVSHQITSLNKLDLNAIIQQMQVVRNSLPNLMEEEIGRSVGLIDQYLEGEVVAGERVRLFVNADLDYAAVRERIQKELDNQEVQISLASAGDIEPNVRGEVFRILREVRGVIAAMALTILFILFFLLDQSAVMSVLKREDLMSAEVNLALLPDQRKKRWFLKAFGWIYAAGLGGIWYALGLFISGAKIPYLPRYVLAIIGALKGVVFYRLADRLYQLDKEEVMAGQSLGLTFTQLMREIVIPAGRPGLLQLLNSRRMVMKR